VSRQTIYVANSIPNHGSFRKNHKLCTILKGCPNEKLEATSCCSECRDTVPEDDPLVAPRIRRLYPHLKLYSSSAEVVSEAAQILKQRDMLAEGSDFTDRYYASDMSDNFISMTDMLFADTDFKIKLLKLEE